MKYYMVMKLQNTLEVLGREGKLPDGFHYVPVFERREEAEEHSESGKYEIVMIETTTTKTGGE